MHLYVNTLAYVFACILIIHIYCISYLQETVSSFASVSLICATPPTSNQSCYVTLNNSGFDNVFTTYYLQVSMLYDILEVCMSILCVINMKWILY